MGVYSFGTEQTAQALKSLPHLQHLLWLMLQRDYPEVSPALVQEMVNDSLDQVLEAMNAANADPFGTATSTPAKAA